MKTITIKQPWASLICEGIKDIENRTWPTKFRGRVLIHASLDNIFKRVDSFRDILSAEQISDIVKKQKEVDVFGSHLPVGSIIGSVEIVDCVINHSSVWADETFIPIEGEGYPQKPTHNWVLANPIEFPQPIPAKGRLGFWDYPNILAETEEKSGELFCHCQLPVKETNQVTGDSGFGYSCRYCGGKWYK